MARRESDKPKPEIRDRDITGLKYFEKLLPLFVRLHEVGCERDTAGNRDLHFDQYRCLVLLFFFNPIVDSLRALQQASELKSVQKKQGVPRPSLGSFSETRQVFDPEWLRPIIGDAGAAVWARFTAEGLEAVADTGGWQFADGTAADDEDPDRLSSRQFRELLGMADDYYTDVPPDPPDDQADRYVDALVGLTADAR